MPVCVLFVSNRPAIVFNPSAGAITDHSQSAKIIDPYFKSKLCEGRRPPTAGTHFTGERAHDRNLISVVSGIRTRNVLIDSPACYH